MKSPPIRTFLQSALLSSSMVACGVTLQAPREHPQPSVPAPTEDQHLQACSDGANDNPESRRVPGWDEPALSKLLRPSLAQAASARQLFAAYAKGVGASRKAADTACAETLESTTTNVVCRRLKSPFGFVPSGMDVPFYATRYLDDGRISLSTFRIEQGFDGAVNGLYVLIAGRLGAAPSQEFFHCAAPDEDGTEVCTSGPGAQITGTRSRWFQDIGTIIYEQRATYGVLRLIYDYSQTRCPPSEEACEGLAPR